MSNPVQVTPEMVKQLFGQEQGQDATPPTPADLAKQLTAQISQVEMQVKQHKANFAASMMMLVRDTALQIYTRSDPKVSFEQAIADAETFVDRFIERIPSLEISLVEKAVTPEDAVQKLESLKKQRDTLQESLNKAAKEVNEALGTPEQLEEAVMNDTDGSYNEPTVQKSPN